MQEFDLDGRPVSLPDADDAFPRIVSVAADSGYVRVMLDISSDLSWFRGHFPQQPVLPGVVQLHWAVLIAQACFDVCGVPMEIKRLKFKKVFTPPQELELTVYLHSRNEVQFGFSGQGEQYSEGRLVFPESLS